VNAAEYRRQQNLALVPLMKLIRALLHSLGVPVTDAQTQEFATRLYRPTVKARDLNYGIARAYLASQHLPSGIAIPRPRDYPFAAMVSTLERTVGKVQIAGDPVTEDNRADVRVIEEANTALGGTVARQAQEPARETVATIGETHEHYGWARVLVGPFSCSFCAMLASRGPVYSSQQAALGRGGSGLGAYHTPYINENGKTVGGVCDCVAVLVPVGSTSWEGYDAHVELDHLWQSTTANESNDGARNAFRREWEKQVRAGETHQYVPESVKSEPLKPEPKPSKYGEPQAGTGGPPKPPRNIPPVAGSPDDRYPDMSDGNPAPLRPSDISHLTEDDLAHIVEGDGRGSGGHGAGHGTPGKTEFPSGWDVDKVQEAVEASLWASDVPRNISPTPHGVVIRALYDGVILEIPIRLIGKSWEVSTAHPISGEGVNHVESAGHRTALPLNIDDLTRRLGS
jgi:hypothetical protein